MQPDKKSICELFDKREQYLIPLFQRGYVWTLEEQIQLLWEDIVDRVEALQQHREDAKQVGADKLKKLRKHFLGAIVIGGIVETDSEAIGTREVIDGQQRITTLQIMLLALRDVLKAFGDEGLDEDLRDLTRNKGSYRAKHHHYKVWPTNVGRDVMEALSELGSLAEVCARFPAWIREEPDGKWEKVERPLMVQAYLFFYAMIEGHLRGKRFDAQLSGNEDDEGKTFAHAVIASIRKHNEVKVPFLAEAADLSPARLLRDALQSCFQVMQLRLDEDDDPQIIFETLNARGAPLTPSDLIRNFIFLRAARNQEDVDALYEGYWRDFDEKADDAATKKGGKFWQKEERQGRLKNSRLDLLMYHYVTLRKADTIKVAHVFEEFKDWWDAEPRQNDAELERLRRLAGRFEHFLAPGQKTQFDLFCRRMQLLDTATATPLLFHMLEAHQPDSDAFRQVMADVESYVVRRFVCGLTTKSYNRTFLGKLLGEMIAEQSAGPDVLRSKLLALGGDSQRWPVDQEFGAAWVYRQLYQGSSTRRVRALLEGLELTLRTSKQEFLPELGPLSVEHVLPQGWKSEDYPLPDETYEAQEARGRLLHSIGNLTLVTPGYNRDLSNKPFSAKRGGLAENSSLLLNNYFQRFSDGDAWNEATITARAETLLPIALQAWRHPGEQLKPTPPAIA